MRGRKLLVLALYIATAWAGLLSSVTDTLTGVLDENGEPLKVVRAVLPTTTTATSTTVAPTPSVLPTTGTVKPTVTDGSLGVQITNVVKDVLNPTAVVKDVLNPATVVKDVLSPATAVVKNVVTNPDITAATSVLTRSDTNIVKDVLTRPEISLDDILSRVEITAVKDVLNPTIISNPTIAPDITTALPITLPIAIASPGAEILTTDQQVILAPPTKVPPEPPVSTPSQPPTRPIIPVPNVPPPPPDTPKEHQPDKLFPFNPNNWQLNFGPNVMCPGPRCPGDPQARISSIQVCIANAGREWSYSGRVEVMGNAIDPSTIRCKVCAKSAAGKMPGTEQCDSDVLNNFHKLDKKPSHVFTDTFDYDVTGCDPAAPLFFIAYCSAQNEDGKDVYFVSETEQYWFEELPYCDCAAELVANVDSVGMCYKPSAGKAMMNYHAHISVENVGTADSLPVTCQLCVADAIPSGYDPYCSPDQHWNFIEVDDKVHAYVDFDAPALPGRPVFFFAKCQSGYSMRIMTSPEVSVLSAAPASDGATVATDQMVTTMLPIGGGTYPWVEKFESRPVDFSPETISKCSCDPELRVDIEIPDKPGAVQTDLCMQYDNTFLYVADFRVTNVGFNKANGVECQLCVQPTSAQTQPECMEWVPIGDLAMGESWNPFDDGILTPFVLHGARPAGRSIQFTARCTSRDTLRVFEAKSTKALSSKLNYCHTDDEPCATLTINSVCKPERSEDGWTYNGELAITVKDKTAWTGIHYQLCLRPDSAPEKCFTPKSENLVAKGGTTTRIQFSQKGPAIENWSGKPVGIVAYVQNHLNSIYSPYTSVFSVIERCPARYDSVQILPAPVLETPPATIAVGEPVPGKPVPIDSSKPAKSLTTEPVPVQRAV